jgi:selenocysteine lyase/cysteine desulfurase
MTRKDFLKWNAAILGGLTLPSAARATGVPSWPGPRAAAAAGDEPLWELVREQFLLDPDWLFLNFGGLGACPLPVLECLDKWSRVEERAPNAGHDEAEWNRVREKLAALLSPKCRAENIGLISGATEGVNMIINGLPLKKGDEVITSTHEHVCMNVGLLNRMQRDGIAIRTFEPDLRPGAGTVERIAALVNDKTRLIIYSHVTCTTGQRLPDQAVAALARAKGIWFALDGAQAPVNLPFDIVDTGVDFYACSTHKWVMGPKRTGFIYVRDGMFDALRPTVGGGGTAKSFDLARRELVLQPNAHRFEYGTQNDALFYALGAAVDFVSALGVDRIAARCKPMAERFTAGLRGIPGIELLSPEEEANRTLMIGFRMAGAGREFGKISEALAKDKIRVRGVTEGGLNSIRVSFFLNNRDEDVDRILASLKKFAAA